MKRVVVVSVIIFSIGCAMPLFAQGAKEKTLFQKVKDSFEEFDVRKEDKVKLPEEIDIFQRLSDYIKEASSRARNQSLRGK